jgi:hypothetical protein
MSAPMRSPCVWTRVRGSIARRYAMSKTSSLPSPQLLCGCPVSPQSSCLCCRRCANHCACTHPGRAEIVVELDELQRLIQCPKGICITAVRYDPRLGAVCIELTGQGFPPCAEGERPQRVQRVFSRRLDGSQTISYAWGEGYDE